MTIDCDSSMVNSNARVLVQDELRQEVVPGVAVVAHQGSAGVPQHMGSIDSDSGAVVYRNETERCIVVPFPAIYMSGRKNELWN